MKPLIRTFLAIFPILCSVSGNVTQTPKRRPVFLPNCSDFEKITNTYTFVDKTLFIKAFLDYDQTNNYQIFTRPRKFGKSTNMDMLRRFVQLEVDHKGRIKNHRETSAYRLFTNKTLNLKISRFNYLIVDHLAQYPVIHIEFKGIMSDSFAATLRNIRDRIRNACLPYEWMIEILREDYQRTKSSNVAQQVRFLKAAIYGKLHLDVMLKSLSSLAKILWNYFRREIFVFIDDYDEAIDFGLRYAHRVNYDTTKVISVMSSMMEELFGEPLNCIKYVMITGIAQGGRSILSSYGIHLQSNNFLSSWIMNTDFGFLESEVAEMMIRRRVNQTEKRKIIEYYNGYFIKVSPNARIYNPNGVLNYMNVYKKKNATYPLCWIDPGTLDFLQQTLKNPEIYLLFLQLLLEKTINFHSKLYVEEMQLLKLAFKLKERKKLKSPDIETLLWYCKQNGYITNDDDSSNLHYLTNKEIESEFAKVLFAYYNSFVENITTPLTETFRNLAEWINIDDEVPNLKRSLETLIKSEFKFDTCKELHYFGLIYHSIASHFKHVFTDIKMLRQDTAYYIVICEREAVIVIAVKYERGIKKALRQAFNYRTDNKLTYQKNIRFIGIKINLKTEFASIAYFSPYNRMSVSFAIESEEKESGLYEMFQVF